MSNSNIFLSVVLPLYNESERLETIAKIYDYFKKRNFSFELITISDGSIDDTLVRLKKLQKEFPIQIISYKKNMGKGYAIRKGMLQAKGRYRMFMDVDLSTPLEEFEKFAPLLNKYDVIIASRKIKDAKLLMQQPLVRNTMGKYFTHLSNIVLNMKVSDFTCGFKCMNEKAANEIFALARVNRWVFDSEVLFLAKKKGFSIKEVPVSWKNDNRSKVRILPDVLVSLLELLSVRLHSYSKSS